MTRSTLSATNRAEVTKKEVRLVNFVEYAFPGATLRYTSGDRDITWGGFTWSANGGLINPGNLEEVNDLAARRIQFTLSMGDTALVTRVMTDAYLFATVKAYVGFCDSNWNLVADPHAIGDTLLMSNAVLSIDKDNGTIELSAETWSLFGDRDSAALATPQSQKLRYPGDTGQDRMAYIQTQIVEWGGRQEFGDGGRRDRRPINDQRETD